MNITKKKNWKKAKINASKIKLLEQLSNSAGVSGNEGEIREIVYKEIIDHTDTITIDPIGNLLATKLGRGRNLPNVMLSAHMDEVGLMLTHDKGDGQYGFEVVGGIDPSYLPGKSLVVGANKSPAVIGAKPVHLTTDTELNNSISIDSLVVDLGPDNSKKTKIGEWATFSTQFRQLGQSFCGKALDDRIGVATLISLLKSAPNNINFMAAFTVQEELGLRGAGVAAKYFSPDLAIAMDCTPALDLLMEDDSENTLYRSKLGSGPAIYIADGATIHDPRLINFFRTIGDVYNIPYQIRQPGGGGTDAGSIHKQLDGIPVISISVPGRYLHSPASIIQKTDWENYEALIITALAHINSQLLSKPR